MECITLSNNNIFYILDRSEYEAIPSDYKTDFIVDYKKPLDQAIDYSIRSAFLPGLGAVLYVENRHFLVIDKKQPIKKFAIWRNHKVVGYCNITQEAADKANKANNAFYYFGFDGVTNPEKYNVVSA